MLERDQANYLGIQMNGIQFNGKPRGYQKSAPGCLGRMVNLFDLTSSVSGNKLLTNKPHNNGSSPSRSQSYDSALPGFVGDEMEDGVVSEFRRSSPGKKPNGTPVKMLIAQEMSQDSDSRQGSPNVVARLMGLDALPHQHPDSGIKNRSQSYSRNSSHSEKPNGIWEEGRHGLFNKHADHGIHPNLEQSECKAIYEIWQQSQLKNGRRDKSPQKGSCNENINEKKMALIRQKFMEAKRLATDENLRQTKEFRDALDVLSSNGELFLKVLQEPSSLISPPETKRITVLKPSKMVVDDKFATPVKRNEKQVKKQQPHVNHVSLWDSHNRFPPTTPTWKANDTPAQPTRIVVLKPSPGRVNNNVRPAVSSTPCSPGALQRGDIFEEAEHEEEAQEAREVAKEITLRMRENLAGHRRDETLLSSVLSNGYTGDESSFEKSENEFGAGNLSDSEVMSPPSRHSWDYVNRYGSPCSSSFSRASFSPESSVCREAKKRLSERWAMMASNGSNVEQRHVRRSSSTLGEMLALSGINNSEICEEGEVNNNNRGQDPRASTSCLRESGDKSPKNLSRSKSVPVTSTVYGTRLNVELSDPVLSKKDDGSMEAAKTKPAKTASFAGKVTSLFFSRSKKMRNEEQSSKPQSHDELQLARAETSGNSGFPGMTRNESSDVGLSPASLGQGISSHQQGVLSVSQPAVPGIQGENQDQPSPISVLEPLFEERAALDCSHRIEPNPYGGKQISSSCLSRSNLIDKSPPIGSIARTLSWDECSAETATSYPMNSPLHILSRGTEVNETELRSLVQSLLTMAGFDKDGQLDAPNLARWHSPENPLDPLLRDKYVDLAAKDQPALHEGKLRQLRSTRKLVFDGVNEALLDIGASQCGPHRRAPGEILGDKVWARMKEEWFSEDVKLVAVVEESCNSGDYNSLVERVVKKEVVGKFWGNQMRVEVDKIGKEIEGNLIQELVEESVLQFTGRD